MYRKTYIEINTDNLKFNVQTLIHTYPSYGYYIGVVKGNTYGHGSASVKHLIDAGINYLAVSSIEEAVLIRKEGITTPILLLQPIHIEDIEQAVKNDLTVTLSSYDYFKKLVTTSPEKELKIHLKINSGFNRLGISDKNQVKEIVETLQQNEKFKLEGIYTHLATSGRYDKHWGNQLQSFREITSLIEIKEIPIIHLDRSLTLATHEKIDFCTGVRIGIAMYGYGNSTPKHGVLRSLVRKILLMNFNEKTIVTPSLKPAFSLYSEVIEINKIKKGEFVGYGATYKAIHDCFVACVSVGYADGFFRNNKAGDVLIHGKRYQIIAVDMGIMTVLVDEGVKVYDKVELIGENISAKEVALRNETSVYEILCEIKESVPRILK